MQRPREHGTHLSETAREYRTGPGALEVTSVEALDCPGPAGESCLGNSILAGLPPEELNELRSYLKQIRFNRGHRFYDIEAPIESVCFPTAGMICLFAVMHDGRTVVLATTGREGFLGVPVFLGEGASLLRAVALMEGSALTLERNQLARLLPSAPQFAAGLRRYCGACLAQVVQIGACHALHNVPQRIAMWLLMIRDRSDSDSLPLTHESLSEMLGCRRPSISEGLSQLQKAGAIRGGRGYIRIVDRARLAEQSCECYADLR